MHSHNNLPKTLSIQSGALPGVRFLNNVDVHEMSEQQRAAFEYNQDGGWSWAIQHHAGNLEHGDDVCARIQRGQQGDKPIERGLS